MTNDSVWELDKLNDAHEYMEQNKNTGKIVLLVNLFLGGSAACNLQDRVYL
jgi:hypothetical protein